MADKYNVLLMRDDSRVRRFRLSAAWLKFFFYFMIILAVIAAGGAYAGWTFWQKNNSLLAERHDLRRQLREANIQLERLQNVEKILQSNDPEELQSLFGTITIESQQKEQQAAPMIDLESLFGSVDLRKAKLSNIALKAVNGNKLRVSCDLNNVDTTSVLSGEVAFALVTHDGEKHDIDGNANDLSFQIQRFKKVVTTFSLPSGINLADVFGLRIMVETDSGETIFSKTYQLSSLMS